jgi:ribonuclease P protein component
MAAPVARLTRRPEFQRVSERGLRAAAPGLVLQALRRPEGDEGAAIRLGLTASRKVGGAVERNRARRRLRALAREVLPRLGAPGHDYVIVARRETVKREWPRLKDDLESALGRLAPRRGGTRA